MVVDSMQGYDCKNETPVLGSSYTCFGRKNKIGVVRIW